MDYFLSTWQAAELYYRIVNLFQGRSSRCIRQADICRTACACQQALVPEIIKAIIDSRKLPEMTLAKGMEPFPVEWEKQYNAIAPARSRGGSVGLNSFRVLSS